ncbi:MAG TPA: PaaI family thioesterase [Rhodopila sp.]|uniref:PaaI family thioesterase n=1 Tax=Rhodopila sp. TaxID=2480087 RepID=UPI002B7CEE4C|nr:PaaI family thioesterase [Rhodopila sp.]HVY17686.1 PaaI family thioesterase [Rhodopila sp.]
MSGYDPAANGWRALTGAAMPGGLGVPWARKVDDRWRYGLLTGPEHANPASVVHGGVLMAFADHGLSFLAWEAAERAACATIQLNTHFLDATRLGEFLELQGEVTRRTRALVFVKGTIAALGARSERPVGAVDGIWRILRQE